MANSTKSKEIEGNLSKAFATIDLDSKDLLFERVRAINEERDDYVNKRAIELASDEYLQRHFRDFVPGTPDEKATFIRSLSLERKIDIIADYTIERRIFEGNEQDRVKLSDIYNSDLMDLKEEYICDKCNHTFFVEASISFNTSKEHEEEYCDTTTIKIK